MAAEAAEALEVLDAGFHATVQDAGRPGLEALGIPPGGAADPWSLAIANVLAGNPPGAAALEIMLVGPTLRALRPVTIALAGADLGARVVETGVPVPPGAAVTLAAGVTLELGGLRSPGDRAYLAVAGGIEVPVVLGARATALGAGFGGLDGRALRSGDRLRAGAPAGSMRAPARWPGRARPGSGDPAERIRVLPGPHADLVGPGVVEALAAGRWTVSHAGDRMGLRLDGGLLPGAPTGELASHGVVTGAVQLPPDRRPIVLLPDHQPTGGYPVVAVVIAADRPLLGQLAPGDAVRFAVVDAAAALDAARRSREAFAEALAHLEDADRWDDLWRHAGA